MPALGCVKRSAVNCFRSFFDRLARSWRINKVDSSGELVMSTDPKRVQALFLAACELSDATTRAAMLERECGEDSALRRRVETLLHFHDDSGSTLDHPMVAPADIGDHSDARDAVELEPPATELPGTRIGAYKLLQKLGEGGMGTVFLAQQDEPVQRRVALKIVKAGLDTANVLARFEQERQALALM